MAEVTLEDRGRALEDQFFEKENQQKLAQMKEKLDVQRGRARPARGVDYSMRIHSASCSQFFGHLL